MLIVRCQNRRGRQITDANGTKEYKGDAVCLHVLGRMSDINGVELREQIRMSLACLSSTGSNDSKIVDKLMRLFCETFKASYWCPSCHAFMDVVFADPGYESSTIAPVEVEYDRVMMPKVCRHQLEVK